MELHKIFDDFSDSNISSWIFSSSSPSRADLPAKNSTKREKSKLNIFKFIAIGAGLALGGANAISQATENQAGKSLVFFESNVFHPQSQIGTSVDLLSTSFTSAESQTPILITGRGAVPLSVEDPLEKLTNISSAEIWSKYEKRAKYLLEELARGGVAKPSLAYANGDSLILEIGEAKRSLTFALSEDATQALYRTSEEKFDFTDRSLGLYPSVQEIRTIAEEFGVPKKWMTISQAPEAQMELLTTWKEWLTITPLQSKRIHTLHAGYSNLKELANLTL